MGLKRAIFLVSLTTATLGVAAAQEAASPAAQPSTQHKRAKPKTAKAKAATPVKPPCSRGQWKDNSVRFGANDFGALRTPAQINGGRGRAGDNATKPKLILKGASSKQQDPIRFHDNLPTPTPHGGSVGLKFPF
jgi:hypothetical protein